MRHDPARLADTREWLGKAANDLRGADVDLSAEPPLLEDALFHCQQAVEKSLKALLAWHDIRFRRTHDLREIGSQAVLSALSQSYRAGYPYPTVILNGNQPSHLGVS